MKKNVLILEDDKGILKILKSLLEMEDYGVFGYEKPDSECINTLVNEKVDLILLDIGLSFFNGIKILKAVREKQVAKKIPVIIVSGKPEKELLEAKKEIGAADIIKKPFSNEEVLSKIEKILK